MSMSGGFRVAGAPMICGGESMRELSKKDPPSIWRRPDAVGQPRVHLPAEAPKYPESKHTMTKTHHNVTHYPITERPGTEIYDPVLLGGKSLIDHYPYASATDKEVACDPIAEMATMSGYTAGGGH